MTDIWIYDREESCCRQMNKICSRYLMSRNFENEVLYSGTVSEEIIRLINEHVNLAVYFLGGTEEIRLIASKAREKNFGSYIVLMVKDISKIMMLLTPAVRPSGIILCPPGKDETEQLLDEIEADIRHGAASAEKKFFTFMTKSRQHSIELDKIIFFEAREKKIYVRTAAQEFSYYGTFSDISSKTDERFVRIHKSYMVNKEHISEINKRDSSVTMDDGSIVYYSRTYKSALELNGENGR